MIIHHLAVIVDIDHIYGPMSVTDEEDGVIIWLQHLKKVNICPAVDENKVPELQFTIQQNTTFNLKRQCSKPYQFLLVYPVSFSFEKIKSDVIIPALCVQGRQCQDPASL